MSEIIFNHISWEFHFVSSAVTDAWIMGTHFAGLICCITVGFFLLLWWTFRLIHVVW